MERELILSALEQSNHNMAASAKRLGISRASLYRKVKEYSSSFSGTRPDKTTYVH
jgi:transcriptional regulator with PAS, ATPase and Fis domain